MQSKKPRQNSFPVAYHKADFIAVPKFAGIEDWSTLTFDSSFTLEAGKTYYYVIKTGSYPQIHHTSSLLTENGWLNCTQFTDVNGREYDDLIPAIKLFL